MSLRHRHKSRHPKSPFPFSSFRDALLKKAATHRRPWPVQGEQFSAIFDSNEFGEVEWREPPDSVCEVMSDVTRPGVVDNECFSDEDIAKFQPAGVFKVRVEFHEQRCSGWWSDPDDSYECGFNVLNVERLA